MNRRQFFELGAAASASAAFAIFVRGGAPTDGPGAPPKAPPVCPTPDEYDHLPVAGAMPAPQTSPSPTPTPQVVPWTTPREDDHRMTPGTLPAPDRPGRKER